MTYIQSELLINLSQVSFNPMPTWMEGLRDRIPAKTTQVKATQLPLFDLSVYAPEDKPSKTQSPSRANPDRQTTVPPSKPRQPKSVTSTPL